MPYRPCRELLPARCFPFSHRPPQARVLAHGQRRTVEQGEIVVELDEHLTKVFVVVSGQLHVLQVSNHQEHVIAICNPGMFTGELNVLSGRRGLVRIRAFDFLLPAAPLTIKATAPGYGDWTYRRGEGKQQTDLLKLEPGQTMQLTIKMKPPKK